MESGIEDERGHQNRRKSEKERQRNIHTRKPAAIHTLSNTDLDSKAKKRMRKTQT